MRRGLNLKDKISEINNLRPYIGDDDLQIYGSTRSLGANKDEPSVSAQDRIALKNLQIYSQRKNES